MYCQTCNEYYDGTTGSVLCPHEPYVLVVIDSPYGWRILPGDTRKLEDAYQAGDRDTLRQGMASANPLIRGVALSLWDALDLKERLTSKIETYEPDHNAEGNWTDIAPNNVQYFNDRK